MSEQRPRLRSGSAMSTKQLAKTVIEGRRVTFHFLSGGEPLIGYLCGLDDFHWMVVTPTGEKSLIHKAAAARVDLSAAETYDSEPQRAVLDEVVAPFRRFVERAVFGRPASVPPATERAAS